MFVDERSSLTMSLPQWDIRHDRFINADGVLEYGVEFELPELTLADEGTTTVLHGKLRDLLKSCIPLGQRGRIIIKAEPIGNEVIEAAEQVETRGEVLTLLREKRIDNFKQLRARGQLFRYRAYFFVTARPPELGIWSTIGKWIVARIYGQPNYQASTPKGFDLKLLDTRVNLTRLVASLREMDLNPRPLGDQDLYELLYRYCNPDTMLSPVPKYPGPSHHINKKILRQHPELAPSTLRSMATHHDMMPHLHKLVLGETHIGIVSMNGFGRDETVAGSMNALIAQRVPYYLVIDMEHNAKRSFARKLIQDATRMSGQMKDNSFSDMPDPGSTLGYEETHGAAKHAMSSGSEIYNTGISIVLYARSEDELRSAKENIARELANEVGIDYCDEKYAVFKQFKVLSPGSGQTNERLTIMFEENIVDLLPMNGPARDSKKKTTIFETVWGTAFGIDLFNPNFKNYNGIIAGTSGTGKTYLAQGLLTDAYSAGAEVFIVERGQNYELITDYTDGAYIKIDPSVSMNPFELPPGALTPSDEKIASLKMVIRTILDASHVVYDSGRLNIVEEAIVQSYQRSLHTVVDPGTLEESQHLELVLMSTFVRQLMNMGQMRGRQMTDKEIEDARYLAGQLEGWTGNTMFGRFIDRPSTININSDLVFFDISKLDDFPELAPVGFVLLATLIKERVTINPGRRKIVLFDEMWALLKHKNAVAMLEDMFRRGRTYGYGTYVATNSFKDLNSEALRGILENTTSHFLLSLPSEVSLVADHLGLNDNVSYQLKKLKFIKGVYSEMLYLVQGDKGLEGEKLINRAEPYSLWAFSRDADDKHMRAETAKRLGSVAAAIKHLAPMFPNGVGKGEKMEEAA